MVSEACLPSSAYYPRTPDYTLYFGVHVCWAEHSELSFIYGFMRLTYGLETMATTIIYESICCGHPQVAIQMSTNNLGFYKENQ